MPSNSVASISAQEENSLNPEASLRAIEIEKKLTKLWIKKGKLDRAIAGCRKILQHQPNDAEIHKQHVDLIEQTAGLEAAFAYYGLHQADDFSLTIEPSEILCCSVVRNELLRLPYFLDYYRRKGIKTFLMVDNDSTDGTLAYLQTQPDVYLWRSVYSFNKANFGSVWFELLLRQYGIGHWCLIVDADEIFYYPDCEHRSLEQLCARLDRKQQFAYLAILLDMYAKQPIAETRYKSGEDFVSVCSYFDRDFYHRVYDYATPYNNHPIHVGGLRERIFGQNGSCFVTKAPLLKYSQDCVLSGGQHWSSYPAEQISSGRGAILHFKYFSSFSGYVSEEICRKEHYNNAFQYQQYSKALSTNPTLNLYSKRHSLRLENSEQLLRLGVMRWAGLETVNATFPTVTAVESARDRPFWSVMITCHRPTFLEKTIKSVLCQALDSKNMQIEVIVDGVDAALQAEITQVVRAVAGDRVQVYCHPHRIRQPHILNLAIARATGHWVHILHDDDWLEPTFYQQLRQGIENHQSIENSQSTEHSQETEKETEIGAAFCRHRYMQQGKQRWISRQERDTAGIIDNWLEKIVTFCHVQFSSMVVKREVYQHIGGFCPEAGDFADWEMWKRIAIHYPIWYEPQPLMNYREHGDSVSSALIHSGEQVAGTRKTIAITQQCLPAERAEELSKAALENYAAYALDVAKQQLRHRDYEAAISNVREALLCSHSEAIQRSLVRLILDFSA